MTEASGETIVRQEGALGHITLNRPKAMNALSLSMILSIRDALELWREDDGVTAVAVDGAGERGLCAGGDIRALHAAITAGSDMPMTFWREEYALNAVIGSYPKPYVVLMDGIVMGGGVGISAHGSHRLVTPRTRIAMPEVTLGFFPDVGGTWLLAAAPGETGIYLGLTGARMSAADAIGCDMADACIDAGSWARILEDLRSARIAGAVDDIVGRAEIVPGPSTLDAHAKEIGRHFSYRRVEEMLGALRKAGTPLAAEALARMEAASPMALKVSLAAIRHAVGLETLDDCLAMELRLAEAMASRGDFAEGIRAAVIDKDQRPRWSPARLEDIDDAAVSRLVEGIEEERT
jgi:enoyl-CoA hydratase